MIRIRLNQEQSDFLADLLHDEWRRVAQLRGKARDSGELDAVAIYQIDLRIVTSIQRELRRAREEAGWE